MAKEIPEHKKYKFMVDGNQFQVTEKMISGAQLRELAKVPGNYDLFLESHGNKEDRKIQPADSIDLSQPGVDKFYTVPPATFGEQ